MASMLCFSSGAATRHGVEEHVTGRELDLHVFMSMNVRPSDTWVGEKRLRAPFVSCVLLHICIQ